MDKQQYVQPPGCAGWLDHEVRPTIDEASNPLFDLSDCDNIRKLARAIASQNDMESAAILSFELSYAYQHEFYNVACIKECLMGLDKRDYESVLTALAVLDTEQNDVARILTRAVEMVLGELRAAGSARSE